MIFYLFQVCHRSTLENHVKVISFVKPKYVFISFPLLGNINVQLHIPVKYF